MSNIEPYIIIGQEIANIEIGSIKKPKFFKITSGERQKKSLLYHAKIGQEYFVYKLNTPIGLCRVHLLRSWRKKAISLFSKPIFENNSELQKLWQILKGIFYIPPVSFPVLINYLKTTIRPNLPNLKLI